VKIKILGMVVILAKTSLAMSVTKSARVIYDEDNRVEIEDVANEKIKLLSKAVAGRIHHESYKTHQQYRDLISFLELPLLSDPMGNQVCADEKFANQPLLPDCSGFLIAEDLLATAGHCLMDPGRVVKNQMTEYCNEYQWIFDYETKNGQVESLESVDRNKIYSCKRVVIAKLDGDVDYAIIQLDRKVTDRAPLKLRKKGKISVGQSIFVIGHPSGLPKKYAGGAEVIQNKSKEYFSTNLDTFGGNSGSPVFNADSLEVEGILVRGKMDYVDSEYQGEYCLRPNRCNRAGSACTEDDDMIDGEQVTRITLL
jgi:V8-like Glu-specific endopeptidase